MIQKAWEVVKGAFTQGLFMAFMMWMSGNSLHIFSIMFLVMFLSTPVRALFAVGPGIIHELFIDFFGDSYAL